MSICDTVNISLSSVGSTLQEWMSAVHAFGCISSNYGSLVAAVIVAIILFGIRELFNKASKFSGVFYTKSTVKETAHTPFSGMRLYHTLVLYSDGYLISGTSEKTGDVSKVRAYEFPGAGKIRGEVSGRIERNYLRASVMNLHIVENGLERESTTLMTIKIPRLKLFNSVGKGCFYSTAGKAVGDLLCGRESFSDHPIGHVQFQSTSESHSSDS